MTTTTPPPVVHTASPTCACADCERVRKCGHETRADGVTIRCHDCGGHFDPSGPSYSTAWRWPGPVAQPAPTAEGGKLAEAIAIVATLDDGYAGLLAMLRAAQSEHAAAWAAAHEHERAAAVASRERDEARAEVKRLTKTVDSIDESLGHEIEGREIRDKQIEELAATLGCREEWSNLHDHYACVTNAATTAAAEVESLRAQLAAAQAAAARPPTAPAAHLPAQAAELRASLLQIRNWVLKDAKAKGHFDDRYPNGFDLRLKQVDEALRLVPVQHDDQQGGKPEAAPCPRCRGCKQIADSDNGEPWFVWAALPPGSDLAVRLGVVKPIPCPVCCPAEGGKVTP